MKSLLSLVLVIGSFAWAKEPIRSLPLDHRVAVVVAVATNRVTTLGFPGPIAAIDAAGVTLDPKVPASFHLAHTRGTSFLSVRALVPGAKANLNVRWNGHTYVFLLEEGPYPILALNLEPPGVPTGLPAPRLSERQLLALLDKARAFPLLRVQQPDAVRGAEFRTGLTNRTDFGDFETQVEEVLRFEKEDSLVFRVVVRNKSEAPLRYRPDSVAVRIGSRVYPQSVSDASGLVPPRSEALLHLAITGTPDGGRADLSIENDFQVLVTRDPAATEAP